MLILGAHMGIDKGFPSAARMTVEEYGANAMQIFTKSPRSRQVKPIPDNDAQEFRKITQESGIKYVIAHSSYLLNFGKSLAEVPWAEKDLTTDFERLSMLGGNGVIVHIGKALDGDTARALQNVIENAKQIIEKTASTNLEYILENTAGQGTEVGTTIEDLATIWKGLKGFSPRVKFCLDTAHLHGAGFDLSTSEKVTAFLDQFDQTIGIKNLSCFHFNDSKVPLGARVDRHINLGLGEIGLPGLTHLARFAVEQSIPLICETPEKYGKTRYEDLVTVREMVGE